jgi:hypothetical protein
LFTIQTEKTGEEEEEEEEEETRNEARPVKSTPTSFSPWLPSSKRVDPLICFLWRKNESRERLFNHMKI